VKAPHSAPNPPSERWLHRVAGYMEPVGDCLEWSGPYMGKTPAVYLSRDALWPSTRAQRQSARSVLWTMANGCRPPVGQVIRPACCNHRCVKAEHWLVIDRKQQPTEQAMRGELSTVRRRLVNMRTARRTGKLDETRAQAIRLSDAPARDEAARHGVTAATITAIRRGQLWAPLVPGASAFSRVD
jgi:hypothetical protein